MKNTLKIITFYVFFSSCFIANAQFVLPTLNNMNPQPPASDPTVKEIFKKLEDTLQIKQGELKVEETKKSQEISKALSPRGKDADEQAGAIGNATNANEVKGNINSPKRPDGPLHRAPLLRRSRHESAHESGPEVEPVEDRVGGEGRRDDDKPRRGHVSAQSPPARVRLRVAPGIDTESQAADTAP